MYGDLRRLVYKVQSPWTPVCLGTLDTRILALRTLDNVLDTVIDQPGLPEDAELRDEAELPVPEVVWTCQEHIINEVSLVTNVRPPPHPPIPKSPKSQTLDRRAPPPSVTTPLPINKNTSHNRNLRRKTGQEAK